MLRKLAVDVGTDAAPGDHDLEGRRRFAKQLASALPLAVHVDIAEAGHLCNLDNPRAYNEELRRFLDDHRN